MFRLREEDEKGIPRFKQSVCFFLEPEEAKAALKAMQEGMPNTKLKLSVHSLGAAFEHCKGWQTVAASSFSDGDAPAIDAPAPPAAPPGQEVPEMLLMGNHALVNSTGSGMRQMLTEHGMEAGSWTLPVFICHALQSKSIMPAFLRPSDLKKTWLAAGRTEEDMPEDIMVLDLRLLIAQMMASGENDWTRLHLVPSDEAVQAAQELAAADTAKEEK